MKKSLLLVVCLCVGVASFFSSCGAPGCPGYWRGNTVSPKAFRAKSAYKVPAQQKTIAVKEIQL